ncbi:MAG: hypothetical protein AAFX78_12430 [Cyanobacteria bacterium J06638_20]
MATSAIVSSAGMVVLCYGDRTHHRQVRAAAITHDATSLRKMALEGSFFSAL